MANKRDIGPPTKAVMQPSMFDILMGRSGYCFSHVGNQSFRALIENNLGWYASVMKGRKLEKMAVISSIMNTIEEGGGKFLRQSSYDFSWYEVNYKIAREKIAHALRDQMNQKSTQERLKKVALQVNSDTKEEATEHSVDQWRSLVLKTSKLHRDRCASVTPTAMGPPTVQRGDSGYGQGISEPEHGIMFNQSHSVNKHNGPRHDRTQLEVSLEQSREWFRSFTHETLQESIRANAGPVTSPLGTDLRSYMGTNFNGAHLSPIHGFHNISPKPLPPSPEWLTPTETARTDFVHTESEKSLQSHCTRSTMSGPCGQQNVVTPQHGPRLPSRESLVAQPVDDLILPGPQQQDLSPPSKEFLAQSTHNKVLSRLVTVDSIDDSEDSAGFSELNSTSNRKTSSTNAVPSKPEETPFTSLFNAIDLRRDGGESQNQCSFGSVDSTCENPRCFCRFNDIEPPLPVDFDASIDLEKLMTGLPDTQVMNGSSKSFTDHELDEMMSDLFQRE